MRLKRGQALGTTRRWLILLLEHLNRGRNHRGCPTTPLRALPAAGLPGQDAAATRPRRSLPSLTGSLASRTRACAARDRGRAQVRGEDEPWLAREADRVRAEVERAHQRRPGSRSGSRAPGGSAAA